MNMETMRVLGRALWISNSRIIDRKDGLQLKGTDALGSAFIYKEVLLYILLKVMLSISAIYPIEY